MSKNNGNMKAMDFQFPQPKEKQPWAKIIHNSEEGTYFGRTIASWAKLGVFYTCFYIVLAAMFAICMQGLFATLSDTEPKWKEDKSLIGTNPGLGFRPLSNETERGSVIQFDTKKPEEGRYWTEMVDSFLDQYNNMKGKFCDFNQTHNASDVCRVNMQDFAPCNKNENYGYDKGQPCIFLKLNRIFNWMPDFYDNIKDLPEDMPQELQDHINTTSQLARQKVWVSCKGQHSLDRERLGSVKFYPSAGFDAYYYPFINQKGYLSPLVAVQFENATRHVFINVECRAWAKNIHYSGSIRDRQGSVSFQLFID